MSNIRYRKDIDGLRAFAVISVVLFHLNVSWVKSGFLGVDIFFVISGYLITSIIIRDLESNSFSIKNFYLRRMRRILPALISVLIATSISAYFILLPSDLNAYSKSLISSIASVSNLYFFKYLLFGYFNTNSSVIPLLHTWSLGIEEQFYFFWPLLLVFMFNLGIKWKSTFEFSFYQKALTTSIAFFILSIFCFKYFSYFELTNYFSNEKFYYFPLTRAFELLLGCILAIHLNKHKVIKSKHILNILAILSLILMLYPLLFKSVPYPSNWTLVACIGATLFIYTGSNNSKQTIIHKIFYAPPIVAIGLISYSLYLWHWPIIAYTNYFSIEKTPLIIILILITSVALASLTYFFVEKPFRYRFKTTFSKTFIFLWIIPLILTILFLMSLKPYNKPNNIDASIFNNKDRENIISMTEFLYPTNPHRCYMQNDGSTPEKNLNKLADPKYCLIGDLNSTEKVSIALIGDSHGNRVAFMLDSWLKNINKKAYISNFSSGEYLQNMEGDQQKRVLLLNKLVKSKRYKYYILAGYWQNSQVAGLAKTIHKIIEYGSIPIVVLDTPALNMTTWQQKMCIEGNPDKSSCLFKLSNDQKQTIKSINALKREFKSLIIIDPARVLNTNDHYPTAINGVQIYGADDKNHITYASAYLIGKIYMNEYGNPLKSLDKN